MGYRSNVNSIIYGPYDKLKTFILHHNIINPNIVFNEFKEDLYFSDNAISVYNATTKKDEKYSVLQLHLEHVKWYNYYPEIEAWEDLLEKANEFSLAYEFIRTGEEPGDIEIINTGNSISVLCVETSIQCDATITEGLNINNLK